MIDPVANEASLRYMAAEIQRLQLLLAQAIGNLALANQRISEPEGASTGRVDDLSTAAAP